MATNVIFIHELPFQPRHQLCRILDADKRWEELGGNYMGYDVTTLTLIGQSIHRDKSPTWELLNKYGEINGTIKRLFIMLAKMDHQRAMSILLPYVDKKYHCFLRNDNTFSTAFLSCSKKDDIPRHSLSQLSMITTNSLSSSSYLSSHKDTVRSVHKEKTLSSNHCKFSHDPANMNKNHSSVSLQSKMKSLNVAHMEPKIVAAKKSPDMTRSKRNSHSKDESISDNCVSEKLKSPKKMSVQEMFLNGNQQNHLAGAANISTQDDFLPDIIQIPYGEICKATDNFNDSRILGRGGFGTVYRGEWKGTSVAIKRLTPRKSSDNPSQQLVSLKQSLNELNVLKCCRFDHILPLYAVSLDGANPCLIYQLMVNGSLEDRLLCKNKTSPLTWLQRSHIAECTAKGLNYLHTTYEKPLVHGDIKSANILLDSNMGAKIGDFGLTREGPGCDNTHVKVTSVHGTECYLPPEYLRHRQLSPQVDIHCYGIVLLEIATGLRPIDPKRETKRLLEHVRLYDETGRLDSLRDLKAGEENMLWFRELIQIGQICSSAEKRKRPPMQEVLSQFEKIKTEVSMMDKIRRLSSDKVNPLKQEKLTKMNLSPIEIQLYYDFQKGGASGVSEKKLLNVPPQTPAASEIPLVIEQMKNMSCNPKDSVSSSESFARDSYISSTSSSLSENNRSSTPRLTSKGPVAAKPEITVHSPSEADSNVPPVPLITMLQMNVPKFGEEENFSQNGSSVQYSSQLYS